MFSYGTGGLHALPLHLVRFLWLPAFNVCSLIGDRLLVSVPVLPSDHSFKLSVVECAAQHQTLSCWCGLDTKILNM